MDIIRAGTRPSAKGPGDWFSGTVRIDPLFNPHAPERVQGASVTFEPGARTAWHTHPLGQTLVVTAGCGLAQSWGGPVREFRAVTLPSVRGEVAVALTLTVIAALKTFDLIYMTTRGGPGDSTTVPSYEVYRQAFELGRVGLASAIGVCLTVVIFAISFAVTRVGEREAA